MSTFSPNLQIEEVARGGDVGTWDTPTNSNWSLMDSAIGNIATIGLNNSNVILNAAQFQSKTITFNSTLTGSVTITFPTSFTKSYEIQHICTGSSAFTITLETTASGGQVICCPPGEIIEVLNDGANLKYKNFGRIGEYWDYAGTAIPNWIQGCTIPPYLNCAGQPFSAATYPALNVILGSTTLPDARGRARFAADQATNRLSSGTIGFNPNGVGNAGGDQNYQAHGHSVTVTDPQHTHTIGGYVGTTFGGVGGGGSFPNSVVGEQLAQSAFFAAATGITAVANTAGVGTAANIPPAYIHGLTLIRAA